MVTEHLFRRKDNYGGPSIVDVPLRTAIEQRAYTKWDGGVLEHVEEDVQELQKFQITLLEFMLAKGIATPQEICDLVNSTNGYSIEVANG